MPPPVTRAVEVSEPAPTTETVPAPAAPYDTVAPLMRPKRPAVVVQKSPLTGAVGAAPWGIRRLERAVVPTGRISPVLLDTVAPATAAFPTTVSVVPNHACLAADKPPEVLIAPVMLLVASRVDGKNVDAAAPVPPKVKSVVAPAHAVNEVDACVMLGVVAGLVIV